MATVLDLSANALSLAMYLAMHDSPDATQITAALWPGLAEPEAAALLDETVAEVNRVVSEASGDPVPWLRVPGDVSTRTSRTWVMVQVLRPRPRLVLFEAGESFPADDPPDPYAPAPVPPPPFLNRTWRRAAQRRARERS